MQVGASVAVAGLVGLGAYALSSHRNKGAPWPPQEKLQPDEETLGPHGFTKQWKNAQGYKIFSYFWPAKAKQSKGILLLLHGHGTNVPFEFLKNSRGAGFDRIYRGSWIEELNNRGYSCCGIDVQSKGRSEGCKGLQSYFESFDNVVADELAFMDRMADLGGKGFEAGLPVFPFAVSMGGARAAMMILRDEKRFKAALFYAPMLSLERVSKKGLNPYLKPMIDLFNRVGPTWRLAAVDKSKFPNLQEEFDKDFFSYHGNTPVRLAAEYLRVTEHIMKNLKSITLPFVTFHSEGDTMVDPDGSRRLVAEASSEIKVHEDCPGSWHVLIHEPGNEKTLEKTIKFLERVNV
ncbi:alpha/beta-hydrolase [Chloropicon primus]|nr:alpha/beta-hydrolase [Chloropicon primus]